MKNAVTKAALTQAAAKATQEMASKAGTVVTAKGNAGHSKKSLLSTQTGKRVHKSNALELACEYRKLVMSGLTPTKIALQAGRSYTYVNNLLKLATATKRTQAQVDAGKVSAWVVIEALRKNSPEAVEIGVTSLIESTKDPTPDKDP